MIVQRWMKSHPIFSKLEGEMFEKAYQRIKHFGLVLYEVSGYRPMTHILSMDVDDIHSILLDIGGIEKNTAFSNVRIAITTLEHEIKELKEEANDNYLITRYWDLVRIHADLKRFLSLYGDDVEGLE